MQSQKPEFKYQADCAKKSISYADFLNTYVNLIKGKTS